MFDLQRKICKPALKPDFTTYDIQNLDSTFFVGPTENAVQTAVCRSHTPENIILDDFNYLGYALPVVYLYLGYSITGVYLGYCKVA